MTDYERGYKDLCVDPKGEHAFDLYWLEFPKGTLTLHEFDRFRTAYPHLTIHYLYDKKVVAIAVVSVRNDLAILHILCSHKEKMTKDGLSLGRYLLEMVYDRYVEVGRCPLLIEPAWYSDETHKTLTAFYMSWKTPDERNDIYDDGKKTGYKGLIYHPKTYIGDALLFLGLIVFIWNVRR
jgi:hypothetical protein